MRSNGKHATRGLQPLAPVLVQTLHQAGLAHVMVEGRLVRQWQDIVGAQIAAVSRPERLQGRVLFVAVSDTVWLQQLTFYHAQVLRNIRRVLGDVPVTRVRFILASSPLPAAQRLTDREPVGVLTTAEEDQIASVTADVDDADLREGIRRAWRRAWTSRRSVP